MNILFVCSKNKWRSRTAEDLFKNSTVHTIRSAGTDSDARIKLTDKLLYWAELIFVMEKRHREIIAEKFDDESYEGKIIVLDIPDEYQYMDQDLVQTLINSVAHYIS